MKMRILPFALALLAVGSASAQPGLKSAEGTTSLLSRDFNSLSVETEDNSLTLLLTNGVLGVGRERLNNFTVTVSASDGSRDVFAGGRWVPGLKLEERYGYTWNLGDAKNDRGFVAAYLSGSYEVASRALARVDGGAVERFDRTSHEVQAGVGVNWAPKETGPFLGALVTAGLGSNIPETRKQSQVCTRQAEGVEDGSAVAIERCESRYLGGVHDVRTGQARLDFSTPYRRAGPPADPSRPLSYPTVNLLASASADFEEGRKTSYNVAAGPLLHPPLKPLQVLTALLFELNDVTDANGEVPEWRDRFAVRLYLGVPF